MNGPLRLQPALIGVLLGAALSTAHKLMTGMPLGACLARAVAVITFSGLACALVIGVFNIIYSLVRKGKPNN